MKTCTNLYASICSFENLLSAARKAQKGKRFQENVGRFNVNLTSQFFANVYLNRFDHFVKEVLRCKFYLRYVDDSVVLGNDKDWLWEVKA